MRPSEALLRGWGAKERGSCSEVRPGLRCRLPKTLVCAEPGWLQSGSSCSVLPPLGNLLQLLEGKPQVGKGRGILLDLQGWREGGCLCGHRRDLCLLGAQGTELCSRTMVQSPRGRAAWLCGCVHAAGCAPMCGPPSGLPESGPP